MLTALSSSGYLSGVSRHNLWIRSNVVKANHWLESTLIHLQFHRMRLTRSESNWEKEDQTSWWPLCPHPILGLCLSPPVPAFRAEQLELWASPLVPSSPSLASPSPACPARPCFAVCTAGLLELWASPAWCISLVSLRGRSGEFAGLLDKNSKCMQYYHAKHVEPFISTSPSWKNPPMEREKRGGKNRREQYE